MVMRRTSTPSVLAVIALMLMTPSLWDISTGVEASSKKDTQLHGFPWPYDTDAAGPASSEGIRLANAGDMDAAHVHFLKAAAMDPFNRMNDLGVTYWRMGRGAEAFGCFETANTLNPFNSGARNNWIAFLQSAMPSSAPSSSSSSAQPSSKADAAVRQAKGWQGNAFLFTQYLLGEMGLNLPKGTYRDLGNLLPMLYLTMARSSPPLPQAALNLAVAIATHCLELKVPTVAEVRRVDEWQHRAHLLGYNAMSYVSRNTHNFETDPYTGTNNEGIMRNFKQRVDRYREAFDADYIRSIDESLDSSWLHVRLPNRARVAAYGRDTAGRAQRLGSSLHTEGLRLAYARMDVEACIYFKKAAATAPLSPLFAVNYGLCLARLGDRHAARAELRRAADLAPAALARLVDEWLQSMPAPPAWAVEGKRGEVDGSVDDDQAVLDGLLASTSSPSSSMPPPMTKRQMFGEPGRRWELRRAATPAFEAAADDYLALHRRMTAPGLPLAERRLIVAQCSPALGLGNRLLWVMSALLMGMLSGRALLIQWPPGMAPLDRLVALPPGTEWHWHRFVDDALGAAELDALPAKMADFEYLHDFVRQANTSELACADLATGLGGGASDKPVLVMGGNIYLGSILRQNSRYAEKMRSWFRRDDSADASFGDTEDMYGILSRFLLRPARDIVDDLVEFTDRLDDMDGEESAGPRGGVDDGEEGQGGTSDDETGGAGTKMSAWREAIQRDTCGPGTDCSRGGGSRGTRNSLSLLGGLRRTEGRGQHRRIGVHLRLGDPAWDFNEPSIAIHGGAERMQSEFDSTMGCLRHAVAAALSSDGVRSVTVVIAADNAAFRPRAKAFVKREFGGGAAAVPVRATWFDLPTNRSSLSGNQAALIDWFALTTCDTVVRCRRGGFSTFSMSAHAHGQTEAYYVSGCAHARCVRAATRQPAMGTNALNFERGNHARCFNGGTAGLIEAVNDVKGFYPMCGDSPDD